MRLRFLEIMIEKEKAAKKGLDVIDRYGEKIRPLIQVSVSHSITI